MDGPITANNLMGVHHAWGRTYKDLFQRYHTMLGKRQRYQNGFDCQGLWVEVEVEKELGLKSKRDIEKYGIGQFVERCKERVWKYADLQTKESQRLGYWMDWDNSYYTMSDENNYIDLGLPEELPRARLDLQGPRRDAVVPALRHRHLGARDRHRGYLDRTHTSVYVRFPLTTPGHEGEALLAWTTTPWTLTSNVAAAVHPDLTYLKVRQGDGVYYLAQGAAATALRGPYETLAEVQGQDLLGLTYSGPFDELPAEAGGEPPRDRLDRRQRRGRDRHRPHRARLRQGRLRALEGARAAGDRAARRVRLLRQGLRLADRQGRRRGRRC